MRFLEFKYQDNDSDKWKFDRFALRKINLLVGQTSAGKTRLLNAIFNLGYVAVREKIDKFGHWEVRFRANRTIYQYILQTDLLPSGPAVVTETLNKENGDDSRQLVTRNGQRFDFDGKSMPKLPINQTAIHLLADEEHIKPVAEGFGRILKRQFDHDELEKAGHLAVVNSNLESLLRDKKSLLDLLNADIPLSLRLHYLKAHFPERYTSVVNQFKQLFPAITSCDVARLKRQDIPFETKGIVPIFVVSEKRVKDNIGVQDLSSGMKKVLLVLTDIASAPEGTIYLIDEYENSLGVNAIDFLPNFIMDFDSSVQFILSSHHPLLINELGIENWLVLSRTGSSVSITPGSALKERYGKSRQRVFTQLLNDPLYFGRDL